MPINEHGQPVGEPVAWHGARPPCATTLPGHWCSVVPLKQAHSADLYAAIAPLGPSAWTYLGWQPAASSAEMAEVVAEALVHPGWHPWTVLDAAGAPQGLASYLRIEPAAGSIEVGGILYGVGLQRHTAGTEAMALLARHAFEDLGYRRYEWKCDSLNAPSRAAALRLGFRYEGTFRQALVYKGRSRDTAWFAMTDADWPAVRAAYEAWLDPANFDESGHQRRRLAVGRAAPLEGG